MPSINNANWPLKVAAENDVVVCRSAVPSSTRVVKLSRKKTRVGLTIQKMAGTEVPDWLRVTCTRPCGDGLLVAVVGDPVKATFGE